MPIAAAKPQKASERVVVLLKPTEKQRLERLARAHHVSSAEILRRSLQAYEAPGQSTDKVESSEKAAIIKMNALLDGMLETLRSTREQVQSNLASIRRQRGEA